MDMQQFEPMSTGQILDRTFRLYRSNFVRFLAIVAIVEVPIGLTAMLWQAVLHEEIIAPRTTGWLVLVFLGLVGRNLSHGALIKSVSESYLGKEATVGESYRFVLPKLGTLIWATILVGVIGAAGLGLFIVPGVVLLVMLSMTTPAIVLEKLKATKAMRRSMALVKGNMGKVFLIVLVTVSIDMIVGYAFRSGGRLLAGAVAGSDLTMTVVIVGAFSIAGEALPLPISATAAILLYYDLRIRKEGFDLEMLAQSLGVDTAAADEQAPTE